MLLVPGAKTTLVKLVHFLNISKPEETFFGIVMHSKETHSLKDSTPKSVKLSGNTMFFKA